MNKQRLIFGVVYLLTGVAGLILSSYIGSSFSFLLGALWMVGAAILADHLQNKTK